MDKIYILAMDKNDIKTYLGENTTIVEEVLPNGATSYRLGGKDNTIDMCWNGDDEYVCISTPMANEYGTRIPMHRSLNIETGETWVDERFSEEELAELDRFPKLYLALK